jgi:hypothetical protein
MRKLRIGSGEAGIAGRSAALRYRALARAWRWRMWPLFLPCTLVAIGGGVASVAAPREWTGACAFVCGIAVASVGWIYASPPSRIRNWWFGSEGERKTGNALGRLSSAQWRVFHDLRWADTSGNEANIDHIVVGPAGVFVLDTKELGGVMSADDEGLHIRSREELDRVYREDRPLKRARQLGYEVHELLKAHVKLDTWVQPVVVLWGTFPQRIYRTGSPVVWIVHGDELAQWLREQPTRSCNVARVAAFLYEALAEGLPDLGGGISPVAHDRACRAERAGRGNGI